MNKHHIVDDDDDDDRKTKQSTSRLLNANFSKQAFTPLKIA